MGLYDDLISTIKDDSVASAVTIGPFVTMVESGVGTGLSTTLSPKGARHGVPAVMDAGALEARTLAELARMVHSRRPTEASLGMAAVNAGQDASSLSLSDKNARDLLMEKASGKRLAMVGHFAFADKVARVTKDTAILELSPRGGDLPAEEAESVIPRAEVVAITGSAFSNGTILSLLDLAKDKWLLIIGPTTPLSTVLFDYGVDAIAGAVVTDQALTRKQAGQGAIFRQLSAVRRVLLEK